MEENILDDTYIEKYDFVVAKFWPRFIAFFIDSVVMWLLLYLLRRFSPIFYEYSMHLSSFIYLLYKPMFEYLFSATLGKMVVGIKVVDLDGNPASFSNILLRNIVRITSDILKILSVLAWFDGFLSTRLPIDVLGHSTSASISSLILFSLFFIDTIVFVFSNKNQALHDIIAKTLVVKK